MDIQKLRTYTIISLILGMVCVKEFYRSHQDNDAAIYAVYIKNDGGNKYFKTAHYDSSSGFTTVNSASTISLNT